MTFTGRSIVWLYSNNCMILDCQSETLSCPNEFLRKGLPIEYTHANPRNSLVDKSVDM